MSLAIAPSLDHRAQGLSFLERKRWPATVLLLAFAGVIVLLRRHTFSEPLECDIATYILMGREMAMGSRLYVDLAEFKPPLGFVIWELTHLLLGTGQMAVLALNAGTAILTMLALYWAGSVRPFGRPGGLLAAGTWTLVGGEMLLQANQPNLEVFMNPLLVLGFGAWIRVTDCTTGSRRIAWFILVGLLLCLSTFVKHHVIVAIAIMSAGWICAAGRDRRMRARHTMDALLIASTIGVLWLGLCLYYFLDGRLGPFITQLVTHAIHYGKYNASRTVPGVPARGLIENVYRGFAYHLIPAFMVFLVPLMMLLVIALLAQARFGRKGLAWMLGSWLFGTLLVIFLPGTYYPHYYQLCLPILAVGASWGLCVMGQFTGQPRAARIATGGVAVILCISVLPEYRLSPIQWSMAKYNRDCITVTQSAEAVNRLLQPGERVYLWGAQPGLYYYSEQRPPSGVMWADCAVDGPMRAEWTRKLMADLESNVPELVLVQYDRPIPEGHPLGIWLGQNYVAVPQLEISWMFPKAYFRKGGRLDREMQLAPRQPPALPHPSTMSPTH